MLPENRIVAIVETRLHLVVAMRARLLRYYQTALADSLIAVNIHVDQLNIVTSVIRHDSPKEAVSIALLIKTRTLKIRFAACQYCIITADRRHTLDYHFTSPPFIIACTWESPVSSASMLVSSR